MAAGPKAQLQDPSTEAEPADLTSDLPNGNSPPQDADAGVPGADAGQTASASDFQDAGVATQPACDDRIPCTEDVRNDDGRCHFTPLDERCDDGGPCTDDACDPLVGCIHVPNDGLCDDGIACTSDSCTDSGACEHLPIQAACGTAENCFPHCGGCGFAEAPRGYVAVVSNNYRLVLVRPADGDMVLVSHYSEALGEATIDAQGRIWVSVWSRLHQVGQCPRELTPAAQLPYSLGAMTWSASGGFYAMSGAGHLYQIMGDQVTILPGLEAQQLEVSGLVQAPDGAFLVLTTSETVEATDLYRYDIATGTTTVVGEVGSPYDMSGLCWLDGALVSARSNGDLVEIDPSNGATTTIGSLGITNFHSMGCRP